MKRIKYTLLFFIAVTAINAQIVEKMFFDMPLALLPSFDKTMKYELVENYRKDNANDSLLNYYGGKARLLQLDTVNHTISLTPTSVSRFDMRVLTNSENEVITAIINSVCAPVCSSYIRFYNADWEEIKMELPSFKNSDWLKKEASKLDKSDLSLLQKGDFIEYSFATAQNRIEVKNNSMELLGIEEKKRLSSCLNDTPAYIEWNLDRSWKKVTE